MLAYNLLQLAALIIGLPVILPHVLTAEKRRETIRHRLGLGLQAGSLRGPAAGGGSKRIWVHALSVGEILSAVPLVAEIRRRHPDAALFVSASTLTGFQTARSRLGSLADGLLYFPYDILPSVRAALKAVSPSQVIIVETDLWPNFMAEAARRGIAVFLVNARISDRSFAGYRRLRFWMAPLLARFAGVFAQTCEDSRRLAALGAARVQVTGNLKFDQPLISASPEDIDRWRGILRIGPDRPVIVAGSTHPGEETVLADACAAIRKQIPDLFPIVAPRNPRRSPEVIEVFRQKGWTCPRISDMESGRPLEGDGAVVDRIGLLRTLYSLGRVAFVGGSLIPAGGHNPLEPAALARPILFGPHMTDFRDMACGLVACGGAQAVHDAGTLAAAAVRWLADPDAASDAGRRAQHLLLSNRGAVERTLNLIDRYGP